MNTKFIHLLYVPTMACNMQCRYCYLEDNTVDTLRGGDCLETLQYAIAKFREADVVPFNISLHGGEVTEYKMFQGILYVFSKTLPKTIPQPPYQAFGTYLKKSDSCFAFPLFIYFVATFTPFSA